MDIALLIQYINVLFREALNNKFLCVSGFVAISFIVLGVGLFWPSTYTTSVTLYADNQNILGPLLRDQAEQTKLEDHKKVVQDMLHSPRILTQVVEKIVGMDELNSAAQLAQMVGGLRNRIKVTRLASGYIKISYSDSTSDKAYNTLNKVVDTFLKVSSEEQRAESRGAFQFIDKQVNQYKDQLILAEERLKEFKSMNFDGRDADVHGSIRRLRDQIEELKISIDENKTAKISLEQQLANESQYSARKYKAGIYTERLDELENRLSTLLLTYTDDYPDVVSLRYQIQDIKTAIREAEIENSDQDEEASESVVVNPLYQELRSRLSQIETEIKTKQKRMQVLGSLLNEEGDRRSRIAERGAQEAELLRDYNVTQKIYEDMLERKEKARLSMTLNIEGQGVTYRILEPAIPPLSPVGLRFFHFVVAGPVLGVLGVLGLLLAWIVVDPRIRFHHQLQGVDAPVLAIVPDVRTSLTTRVMKTDVMIAALVLLLFMAVYIGLAYAGRLGLING